MFLVVLPVWLVNLTLSLCSHHQLIDCMTCDVLQQERYPSLGPFIIYVWLLAAMLLV